MQWMKRRFSECRELCGYKDSRLWSEECHCAVVIHVQTLDYWPQLTEKTYMTTPADKAGQCGVYTWLEVGLSLHIHVLSNKLCLHWQDSAMVGAWKGDLVNAENYVASYKDWRLWSEECHCAVLIHVQTLNVWPQVTEKTYMAAPADKARQCGVYTWSQARDRSVIPKLLHLHFSFLLVPNCFCQSHSPIGHSSHFLHLNLIWSCLLS